MRAYVCVALSLEAVDLRLFVSSARAKPTQCIQPALSCTPLLSRSLSLGNIIYRFIPPPPPLLNSPCWSTTRCCVRREVDEKITFNLYSYDWRLIVVVIFHLLNQFADVSSTIYHFMFTFSGVDLLL